MPNTIFQGLFDTAFTQVIEPSAFLLCVGTALAAGLILCFLCQWRAAGSGSFCVALALLPAAVCVVIMMVNGNVGTGVAVAGAFSLVRFRSAAGTGREIIAVFIAMGAGLLAGMGYLGYCLLFVLILGGMMAVYTTLRLGETRKPPQYRQLRITIPENLDYVGVFDPVLDQYTSHFELVQVKTTNMGSLFKLTYDLTLPEAKQEKLLLDELRCLNGNLEIALSYRDSGNSDVCRL